MHNPMVDALNFRDSCTAFLSNQPVPIPRLEQVLEAGRLSPSAMGMEPWRFFVTLNDNTKTALQAACRDQSQLASGSAIIIVVARISDLTPGSHYVRHMLQRGLHGAVPLEAAERAYAAMLAGRDLAAWSIAQCHVAATNMMAAAAFAELDSCPIWDFDAQAVARVLKLDPYAYRVALPLVIGYRAVIAGPHRRRSLEELVSYC